MVGDSTAAAEGTDLADRLVRGLVAEVAPEELPLVDLLRGERPRTRRDEPLGSGVGEVVLLVTPVAVVVGTEVVKKLAGMATDRVVTTTAKTVRTLRDRLRRKPAPLKPQVVEAAHSVVTSGALSEEHLAEVHALAMAVALAKGLTPETAARMGKTVVDLLTAEQRNATPPAVDAG